MSVLDILKSEPPSEEITDKEAIKKHYRYWRIRIFYSIYMGYALFYFTRKSFAFVMPALITELGFTKSELGILGTLLALSYGVSKFLSGILSDKSNLRYFMGLGLLLTGVFNLCFGLSSSIALIALFLGLNGPVVKSHGGTDSLGFSYSIELCYKIAKGKLIEKIKNNLSHTKNLNEKAKY